MIAGHRLPMLIANREVHVHIATIRSRIGFALVRDRDNTLKRIPRADRMAPIGIFNATGPLAAVLEKPEPHHRAESG